MLEIIRTAFMVLLFIIIAVSFIAAIGEKDKEIRDRFVAILIGAIIGLAIVIVFS